MSSWITANLLTLNCSNEFFLADSKRQLPIIQNSSAPPIQLAALVLSLMDTILFYDILSLSKSHFYHIRQVCCIRRYLDSTTVCTIITTSIAHDKLDYCNSLYHNIPKSELIRLLQIQNSFYALLFKLLNHVIPIPSYAAFTG